MNNILITGGTGFLGSHIAKRLVDTADQIVIPTTDIRQKTSFKFIGLDENKINLVPGDIRDFDFLKLLFS